MKKQIIFIEGFTTVMFYKIAKVLRTKGYETILIRILKPHNQNNEFYNEAFDQIIDFNITYFNIKNNIPKIVYYLSKQIKHLLIKTKDMKKLKPYVIIGRAPISTTIAFFRLFFWKYPYIYFPYDIRSQAFSTKKMALKEIPWFEIYADRFCFEHSDGLLHKGDPEEINFIEGRILGKNIKFPKNIITFHPYCLKEFMVPINKNKLSKKNNEIHFVFIGGTGKKTKDVYLTQLTSFSEILEQKIHVHLYFSSDIEDENAYPIEQFITDCKDYPNIKYFHLYPSLNPKEIVSEISKYDFGISPYDLRRPSYNIELQFCTGNKISSYFEAGLPFIYSSKALFFNKLLKDYGLNLNWPDNMNKIKKKIQLLNYQELEKNVLKIRNDFLMEKNIDRLIIFFDEVVKEKNR